MNTIKTKRICPKCGKEYFRSKSYPVLGDAVKKLFFHTKELTPKSGVCVFSHAEKRHKERMAQ